MAWFSLASVLFYILSGCSWGPMKKAEVKFSDTSEIAKVLKR